MPITELEYQELRRRRREIDRQKAQDTDLGRYLQMMVPIAGMEMAQCEDPIREIGSLDLAALASKADVLLTLPAAEWGKYVPPTIAVDLAKGVAILRRFDPEFGAGLGVEGRE